MLGKLFKASGIDDFDKTVLYYSLFGEEDVTCKINFFKDLKKLLDGGLPFQIEEDECF
jgi:hypothetical protein